MSYANQATIQDCIVRNDWRNLLVLRSARFYYEEDTLVAILPRDKQCSAYSVYQKKLDANRENHMNFYLCMANLVGENEAHNLLADACQLSFEWRRGTICEGTL